jgi:hypothetical protein
VSFGQDWPTEELRDVLQTYNFRILGRERRRSGPAPWWKQSVQTSDGKLVYDPDATWTETHYLIRRDIVCEACGEQFGYNFEVDQVSRVHEAGRGTDGSLRREIGRQLRRRIRCPHCRAAQKEPRRSLRRAEHSQTGFACGLILIGFFLFGALGALGGWLAGIAGFFIGLFVALAGMLALWFFAFPYVLGRGPEI